MRKSSTAAIALLLMLVLAVQAVAGNGSGTKVTSEQDKRKAEYIFLQAQAYKVRDSLASYYDLIKYAYHLDSTNTAISYYYGYLQLLNDNSSRADKDWGLGLMQRHVEAHPEDYYEATFFTDACMSMGKQDVALKIIEKLAEINPTKTEVLIRLASAYVSNEKFTEALQTYERIEEFEGKSIEITARKVMLCSQLGDTIGAIDQMRRLYNEAPSSVDYNLVMSELFGAYNMKDSALYYLDRAQMLEPDNGNVYFAKAQYYDEIGDTVNYDKEIYNALVSTDLDVDTKLDVLTQYTSMQLMRNDSTQRVNNLFKVLIGQHPHEPKVHELYSMYLSSMKDYRAAAEEIEYELDLDPTDTQAWQRLMVVNMWDENYPGAIKAAQKAIEYNPDNIDLYRYIAPAYFQMKEYDQAIATYDKALSLVNKDEDGELYSDILGGKGDIMVELGDTTAGFQLYDEALAIFPGNTSIMNNYAYFLALNNMDLDRAESMAAKAVYANPDNATFIDTYAWVFFKKKNYDMALLYIRSAISNSDAPSADILEHYGDILFMTGDKEGALRQWEKALELDSENELLRKKVENKTYYEK